MTTELMEQARRTVGARALRPVDVRPRLPDPEDDGREAEAPRRTFPDAADLAMRIGGPVARLVTGWATVDQATRGGIPYGRLVGVAGPPGVGKTSLVTDAAHRAAKAGCSVVFLCSDEARETIMIRWGQLEGIPREDLEHGLDYARERLATSLRSVDVCFVDADEDEAAIEDAATELARRAGDRPRVLVVDSIQTVRAALAALAAPSRREGIDLVVAALKRVSKAGALVLATSEVSRGWYRSGKERIDPLAAFKESGGIEYGLALGFVMLGVEDDEGEPIPGFSDVFTAKNRVGTVRPIFRLRQDFTSARFEEVGRPPASRGRKPKGTDEPIDSRILRTARDGHYATAEDLQRDVVGRRTTVLEAIRDLREAGRLVLVGGRLRPAVGGHDD